MEINECGLCGARGVELTLVSETYVCPYCLRSYPEVTHPGVARFINRGLNDIEKAVRALELNRVRHVKARKHLLDMLVLLKSRLETSSK